MISRSNRLWAITSTLMCLAPVSFSQDEEFEATLSTPVVIDTNTGDLVATDNAQLTYGDWLVSADEIRLNRQTNRAIASGNVVFAYTEDRNTGRGMPRPVLKNFGPGCFKNIWP